jgi:hypothetical protein
LLPNRPEDIIEQRMNDNQFDFDRDDGAISAWQMEAS